MKYLKTETVDPRSRPLLPPAHPPMVSCPDWDDVFAAVKRCHEVVHEMGAVRISSSMRIGTRVDREQTMDDKIRSVEEKLNG